MKNLLIKVTLAMLVIGWFVSANAKDNTNVYAKDNAKDNLISVGASGGGFSSFAPDGPSLSATLVKVEYERKFSDLITLTGGLAHLTYTTTDTDYHEDGSGRGVFVDVSFYPMKHAMKGFYVGPGVGLTSITSSWSDSSLYPTIYGTISGTAWDVHAKAGWKFNTGGVVIDPNVRLGYFLNSPTVNVPTSGRNAQYKLDLYLLFGVNVGMPF
jgi:hypothetical protein